MCLLCVDDAVSHNPTHPHPCKHHNTTRHSTHLKWVTLTEKVRQTTKEWTARYRVHVNHSEDYTVHNQPTSIYRVQAHTYSDDAMPLQIWIYMGRWTCVWITSWATTTNGFNWVLILSSLMIFMGSPTSVLHPAHMTQSHSPTVYTGKRLVDSHPHAWLAHRVWAKVQW